MAFTSLFHLDKGTDAFFVIIYYKPLIILHDQIGYEGIHLWLTSWYPPTWLTTMTGSRQLGFQPLVLGGISIIKQSNLDIFFCIWLKYPICLTTKTVFSCHLINICSNIGHHPATWIMLQFHDQLLMLHKVQIFSCLAVHNASVPLYFLNSSA
jgi:hypothetical protein